MVQIAQMLCRMIVGGISTNNSSSSSSSSFFKKLNDQQYQGYCGVFDHKYLHPISIAYIPELNTTITLLRVRYNLMKQMYRFDQAASAEPFTTSTNLFSPKTRIHLNAYLAQYYSTIEFLAAKKNNKKKTQQQQQEQEQQEQAQNEEKEKEKEEKSKNDFPVKNSFATNWMQYIESSCDFVVIARGMWDITYKDTPSKLVAQQFSESLQYLSRRFKKARIVVKPLHYDHRFMWTCALPNRQREIRDAIFCGTYIAQTNIAQELKMKQQYQHQKTKNNNNDPHWKFSIFDLYGLTRELPYALATDALGHHYTGAIQESLVQILLSIFCPSSKQNYTKLFERFEKNVAVESCERLIGREGDVFDVDDDDDNTDDDGNNNQNKKMDDETKEKEEHFVRFSSWHKLDYKIGKQYLNPSSRIRLAHCSCNEPDIKKLPSTQRYCARFNSTWIPFITDL